MITRFIPEAERPHLLRYVGVFTTTIVVWAVLHDIVLITIEPRHFTEFHRPVLPLSHPVLLALQYATIASAGPAMAYGALAWWACRAGAARPLPLRRVWAGFISIILALEACVFGLGWLAARRFDAGDGTLLPAALYPDDSRGIAITQTINLAVYAMVPACAALYLAILGWRRRSRAQERVDC